MTPTSRTGNISRGNESLLIPETNEPNTSVSCYEFRVLLILHVLTFFPFLVETPTPSYIRD